MKAGHWPLESREHEPAGQTVGDPPRLMSVRAIRKGEVSDLPARPCHPSVLFSPKEVPAGTTQAISRAVRGQEVELYGTRTSTRNGGGGLTDHSACISPQMGYSTPMELCALKPLNLFKSGPLTEDEHKSVNPTGSFILYCGRP